MKDIINQARLLIAEMFLRFAADIAPKETNEGKTIFTMVYDYMIDTLIKNHLKNHNP